MAERAGAGAGDEPAEVRAGERLDEARLATYLAGVMGADPGPLVVQQFPKGHSNLTYLVRAGTREWVLRRAPFGAQVKTAHDMLREHTILAALAPVYPLAPRPVAYCADEGVLGAPFYLMERVRGVILRAGRAPAGLDLGPDVMRRLSTALVDGLAALHAVDWRAAGLGALGHPEGYVARQVKGWTERYVRAQTDEVTTVEAAARWLGAHLPAVEGAALVHNDYKYDNVVLDPADLTRIVAVLDWEMATVGDPLLDLGTSLGYWVDPDDPDEMKAMPLGPTTLPGNLSRREVWARYAERSAASSGAAGEPLFYYVFGLFKIAVIAQQIYQRFVAGHTKDPRFGALIVGVRILGEQAARALDRGRIHALG
ncbi:MAG: phosphotransferase family protein [Myxococcales bacterium]|nr:phosphotransferase family protein [Myxococcales bacterium]